MLKKQTNKQTKKKKARKLTCNTVLLSKVLIHTHTKNVTEKAKAKKKLKSLISFHGANKIDNYKRGREGRKKEKKKSKKSIEQVKT